MALFGGPSLETGWEAAGKQQHRHGRVVWRPSFFMIRHSWWGPSKLSLVSCRLSMKAQEGCLPKRSTSRRVKKMLLWHKQTVSRRRRYGHFLLCGFVIIGGCVRQYSSRDAPTIMDADTYGTETTMFHQIIIVLVQVNCSYFAHNCLLSLHFTVR